MSATETPAALQLKARCDEQGNTVRKLKDAKADKVRFLLFMTLLIFFLC